MQILSKEEMKGGMNGGSRAANGEEAASVACKAAANQGAVRSIVPSHQFASGRIPAKKITTKEGTMLGAEKEVVWRQVGEEGCHGRIQAHLRRPRKASQI
jgi:hypothetical protein